MVFLCKCRDRVWLKSLRVYILAMNSDGIFYHYSPRFQRIVVNYHTSFAFSLTWLFEFFQWVKVRHWAFSRNSLELTWDCCAFSLLSAWSKWICRCTQTTPSPSQLLCLHWFEHHSRSWQRKVSYTSLPPPPNQSFFPPLFLQINLNSSKRFVLVFAELLTALSWLFPDNLKENDKELRAMLKRVWPKLTKKTLDKVVPKPPSLINNGKCPYQIPCFPL